MVTGDVDLTQVSTVGGLDPPAARPTGAWKSAAAALRAGPCGSAAAFWCHADDHPGLRLGRARRRLETPATDLHAKQAAVPRCRASDGVRDARLGELPPERGLGQAILAARAHARYAVIEQRAPGIGERRMIVQSAPGPTPPAPDPDDAAAPHRDGEETFPADGARHPAPGTPMSGRRMAAGDADHLVVAA
ncbi:hypothetical protein ABT299_24005 [Spirillospora sp. NPDC000708]